MKSLSPLEQMFLLLVALAVAAGMLTRFDVGEALADLTGGWLGQDHSDRPPPRIPGSAADAAAALDGLIVTADIGPLDGYTRDQFGPPWTDDVSVEFGHNGCDTRNDILRRDAEPGSLTIKADTAGCKVLTGAWISPYTGERTTDRGDIQIDHIVPLANAWRSGASSWSDAQLQNFAGDPLELRAVDAASNQAKGESAPDEWLPELGSFHCSYGRAWIAVKANYRLSVTADEKLALQHLLAACPT